MHKYLATLFTFLIEIFNILESHAYRNVCWSCQTADILFSLWFYIWNVYIIRGPIATEDEESISNGGADEKQQNNDAENKVEDSQNELKEANRSQSFPESSTKEPACKVE